MVNYKESFKEDFVFKYEAFFVCLFQRGKKIESNNDERVHDSNNRLLWLIEGYH